MAQEPIKPSRTDAFSETRGEATAFGCQDVQTPHGLVHFHDAAGLLTALVELPDRPTAVGVMVYNAHGALGRRGEGLFAQLDPEAARSIGASLIRLANMADPRPPQ